MLHFVRVGVKLSTACYIVLAKKIPRAELERGLNTRNAAFGQR